MRVVYIYYKSSFDELIKKYDSCTIHERNLQKLVTEIFNVKMNLAAGIMKDVFEFVECPCCLKNEPEFTPKKFQSVKHEIETTEVATGGVL